MLLSSARWPFLASKWLRQELSDLVNLKFQPWTWPNALQFQRMLLCCYRSGVTVWFTCKDGQAVIGKKHRPWSSRYRTLLESSLRVHLKTKNGKQYTKDLNSHHFLR